MSRNECVRHVCREGTQLVSLPFKADAGTSTAFADGLAKPRGNVRQRPRSSHSSVHCKHKVICAREEVVVLERERKGA